MINLVEDVDKKLQIATNMNQFGGSFVKALSNCISLADSTNLKKIQDTWPELIERYTDEKWRK